MNTADAPADHTIGQRSQQVQTDCEQPPQPPYPVEMIRRRAYQLYEWRGSIDGYALDDWLQAEAEALASIQPEQNA